MPKTALSQDERQLIKLVEKMHIAEAEKASLLEQLRDGQMSEDLAGEIRQKLTASSSDGADDEQHLAIRNRHLTELAMLVKRWRLSNQSRNFGRK